MRKMDRSRKAQIGMMETMAILFIFFFLLVLGFIFYAGVSQSSYIREVSEKQDLEAIEVANKALFLPDIECPTTMHKDNCVDKLKLDAVAEIIQSDDNRLLYYDTLRYATIEIEETYPTEGESWVVYNFTNPEGSLRFTHMPIVIYDPIDNTFSMGIMKVSHYTPPTGEV